MAKKRRRKKNKKKSDSILDQETHYAIIAVLLIVLAFFFILAAFGRSGVAGTYAHEGLSHLFGIGYALLPLLSVLLALAFIKARHRELFGLTQIISAVLFLAAGLGLIDLLVTDSAGLVGAWVTYPLISFFDTYVSGILLLGLIVISLLIMFNLRVEHFQAALHWIQKKREKPDPDSTPQIYESAEDEEGTETDDEEEAAVEDVAETEDEEKSSKRRGLFGSKKEADIEISTVHPMKGPYKPPPISLLEREKGKASAGDVKANANIIKRTLANFGIDVEIEEVTVGPSIARYAIKPAEGVRLSKILSLQNNLELALAAHPVRIEAPIPGKSLVGIEVPNSAKSTVGLHSLLKSKELKENTKPLSVPLGRIVSGSVKTTAISAMPHLLIAGATGAGKSVMIHTIITSLLYQNSPSQLKLILIDPKRVELTLYKDIPHLLTPVITDAKQAVLALKWLTSEMERRYDILEEHAVRDIASYHAQILKPALDKNPPADRENTELPEALPYVVLVIDELADIMSTYPRELEASIVRIAQMSRAVGIHLVLSTQRPSVNVITGLIKANIPARIALQVTSQIDSRTILDAAGAEKLLGAGDLLFISGEMSKPVRLQSGFISEREVKKVSSYLRKHHEHDGEEITFTEDSIEVALDEDDFDDDEDELYEDARETVLEAGKASTSYLQRKLRVGYARAARLMDMLEERGVVGPQDGSKPRDVLIDAPDDDL